MSLIGDLFIKIKGDNSNYNRSLDDSKKKTSSFGNAVKKIGGLIAGAFAVGAIVNFARNAIRVYDIQAKAEQQLLTALKGRKDVQQELIVQAEQLQKTTLFGDEETIKAQALIAAFVKEKDQIKTIIPLVQDLASAKMMQLSVAADLVSKTLGSSTNALSRYGIEVTGAVGSQERLLSLQRGLNDAFGGQAQAAAKAGVGAIKQLENAWGDFQEQIGKGGSGFINSNARFLTALLSAITGNMKKAMEENLTDAEKFQSKLENSTNEGLKTLRKSWEQQSQYYFKLWQKALKDGDAATRSHYATQYDLTKETISLIDKEIKKRNENNDSTEHQVTLLEAAKQAAKDAAAELELFKNKGGKFAGEASAQAYIDKLKELTDAAQKAQGFVNSLQRTEAPSKITPISAGSVSGQTPNLDTSKLGDMSGFLKDNAAKNRAAMAEYMADWNNFMTELNQSINQGLSDAITSLASGLGQLAAGAITGKDFGKQVLGVIGKFMTMMGGLFITMGVSMLQMQASLASLNPFGVIAAGVALVAAGAAISSLASKGPSGVASGGGSYSAAGGYSSGQQRTQQIPLKGEFELRGDKLVAVIDNTNRRRSVIG